MRPCGVNDPFRIPSCSACVEHVEWVVGLHRNTVMGRAGLDFILPVDAIPPQLCFENVVSLKDNDGNVGWGVGEF